MNEENKKQVTNPNEKENTGVTQETAIPQGQPQANVQAAQQVPASSAPQVNPTTTATPTNPSSTASTKTETTPTSTQGNDPTPQAPKGSKVKTILAVFLFIGLFAMVYFLPEISDAIKKFQEKEEAPVSTKEVESGTMVCTLSKEVEESTVTGESTFYFTDKKLKRVVTKTTHSFKERATGTDAATLEELQNSCLHLGEVIETVDGMNISCKKTETNQITEESINYEKLDLELIHDNIAEFEGIYPEFQRDQDIDEIQSLLQGSGYTCEKQ